MNSQHLYVLAKISCLWLPDWQKIWGCSLKFTDWPPGARTENGTALCHYVQLCRYFVTQSSEFCRHKPLCCFSTSVYCCCLLRYRLSPETFLYTLVLLLCQHYYNLQWDNAGWAYTLQTTSQEHSQLAVTFRKRPPWVHLHPEVVDLLSREEIYN
jgi:hypothetical protein